MKWTKEKLDLFFAMKDEGCSIPEICNALGCERQAVYDKVKSLKKLNGGVMPKYNKREDNDMSCYEKRVQIDPAEMWQMVDDGKSRKEIADHYGVSVQTIANRITKGRPKAEKIGNVAVKTDDEWFDEIIDGIDAGKRDKVNETTETVIKETETVIETTETVVEETETQFETVAKSEPETLRDTPETETHMERVDTSKRCHSMQNPIVNEPPRPDIFDLVFKARYMAIDAGFEPTHMVLDLRDIRSDIIVSGEDADGKVYELHFSVSDPSKFPKAV